MRSWGTVHAFTCLFVRLSISAENTTGQSVNQTEGTVVVTQGKSISLHCSYTSLLTTSYPFWYVQYPGQPPRVLLMPYGTGESHGHGFQADHLKKDKTFNMKKSASKLDDSAVYFCAVSDTVGPCSNNADQKPPSGTPILNSICSDFGSKP